MTRQNKRFFRLGKWYLEWGNASWVQDNFTELSLFAKATVASSCHYSVKRLTWKVRIFLLASSSSELYILSNWSDLETILKADPNTVLKEDSPLTFEWYDLFQCNKIYHIICKYYCLEFCKLRSKGVFIMREISLNSENKFNLIHDLHDFLYTKLATRTDTRMAENSRNSTAMFEKS